MKQKIVIALDACPISMQLHNVSDYGGEQVFSKVALPLFVESDCLGPKPLAASKVEISNDHRVFDVTIRSDLKWSNGGVVTAHDYIYAFKSICLERSSHYFNLLSDLEGYKEYSNGLSPMLGVTAIGDYQIRFRLRNRNQFFLQYLTLLSLSPMNRERRDIHCGPYELISYSNDHIVLERNKYYQIDHRKNTADVIRFENYDKPRSHNEALERYDAGQLDITCDTALTYEQYHETQDTPSFQRIDLRLAMLLAPGQLFRSIPNALRRQLHVIVNRQEMVQRLLQIPAEIRGYYELYSLKNEKQENNKKCTEKVDSFNLIVAYDEYYPNGIVVELLREQFSKFGVTVETRVDNYGMKNNQCHLRLELRKSLKTTPILLYKADLLRGYLTPDEFHHAHQIYSVLLRGCSYEREVECYKQLDLILSASAVSIPLLSIPGGAYCREGIKRNSVWKVGHYVHFEK